MPQNQTILCYYKIPFTEERTSIKMPTALTIRQFIELSNAVLHEFLNIHYDYIIEVVETNSDKGEYGPSLTPTDSQTLEQRYGQLSPPISFYARPVNAETRTFVRQDSYSS